MSGSTQEIPTAIRERSSLRLNRRDFLAGAAALTTGLILDTGMIARHDIDLSKRVLKIRRLPDAFHGFRIIQMSDIHLDQFTERSFLQLAVHRINALAPDLVLLTGDFASRGYIPLKYSQDAVLHCAHILKGLACPQRFGVLGNHDTAIGSDMVVSALAASDVPVLVNRFVPIERQGRRLWLGGVDDPGTAAPILDLAVPQHPDGPVILMSHPPDFADEVVRHPRGALVDVMLSGHTHGGQIRIPFVGPLALPPMGRKYISGFFRFNQMQLYVSRGIGTVGLPFRLNCPPEITEFTLQPA